MAIEWTGIKRANEETAQDDNIAPIENSGSPGDVAVGSSAVFIKTSMYGDKWLSRFDTLPEYNDPFKRGYIPWYLNSAASPYVERFSFVNETAGVSLALTGSDGYFNLPCPLSSSTTGYILGGYDPVNNIRTSSIRKTLFSVETDFMVVANFGDEAHQCSGVCSSSRGYRCGGSVSGSPGLSKKCDYVDFSNDESNATSINDLNTEHELASTFSSTTYGYLFGGLDNVSGSGQSVSTIRKINFATGNQFTSIAETTKHACYWYSTANSTSRGYQVRGYEYQVGPTNYYYRFALASETTTVNALTAYVPSTHGTTNSQTALYTHESGNRGKMFFGTDTEIAVCAYYDPPSTNGGRAALDTTDNNGFIFAN